MRNELGVDEIRSLIRRFEEKNNLKTLIIVLTGVAIITFVVVILIIKIKDRLTWGGYDDFDDDYDEFDYEDYDDDDDDDEYITEDYHALDYEDEDGEDNK